MKLFKSRTWLSQSVDARMQIVFSVKQINVNQKSKKGLHETRNKQRENKCPSVNRPQKWPKYLKCVYCRFEIFVNKMTGGGS